jgi:Ca2+-binding EF-hand superfamily protein
VFSALDKDNDGYLDEREVRKGLLCLGFDTDAAEARRYLRMMDSNSVHYH